MDSYPCKEWNMSICLEYGMVMDNFNIVIASARVNCSDSVL